MAAPNSPDLVAKALAKAQSTEARLDALVADQGAPVTAYSVALTVVDQTTAGAYTWTCPAGVTVARIQCWGAGAGGNGGNSGKGAEAGGGGAYAEEPAYPVVPGTVYNYQVGDGGDGAMSNAGQGSPGAATYFDLDSGAGVYANGGSNGAGAVGGFGGAVTPGQTISFAGGPGGGDTTQLTGGCGGGSSASPTGNGLNGAKSTSGTGAAGGAGATDRGAGAAGGNAGVIGSDGGSPGGGGGGVGAATVPAGLVILTYNPTASATYYGSDALGGNANSKSLTAGALMQQGGSTTDTFSGTMKAVMLLPPTVASDLAAVTVDNVTLQLSNISTWYSSGMTVQLGYGAYTTLGASYSGAGLTPALTYNIPQGTVRIQQASDSLAAPLKTGTATALVLGLAPAYNLSYYGSFAGAGQLNPPVLTVVGHTGAAPIHSGDGSDGEVRITYATQGVPVAGMMPAAVTDAAGHDFATGFTGQGTAFQPGSSPANVETWHTVTLDGGWATGTYDVPAYRLNFDGDLQLDGRASISFPSNAGISLNSGHPLPAAYRPVNPHDPRTGDLIGSRCHIAVTAAGVINALPPSGATFPNTYFAEIDSTIRLT